MPLIVIDGFLHEKAHVVDTLILITEAGSFLREHVGFVQCPRPIKDEGGTVREVS